MEAFDYVVALKIFAAGSLVYGVDGSGTPVWMAAFDWTRSSKFS